MRSNPTEWGKAFGQEIVSAVKGYVGRMMAPYDARLAALEAKVAALEARPAIHDRGVWRAGEEYPAGALVSFQGSAWIAQRATRQRPGDGDSGWRLAVKRGKADQPRVIA